MIITNDIITDYNIEMKSPVHMFVKNLLKNTIKSDTINKTRDNNP